MAALTIQNVVPDGLLATYSAVNSSDTMKCDNTQRHFLHVKNGGGGSINVTITAVDTSITVKGVGTVTVANKVIAVANGTEKLIGPFSAAYKDAAQTVAIAYSGTSSVTAAALKMPKIG